MSFSEIRLPDVMIAAIYGSVLVPVPSTRQNPGDSNIAKMTPVHQPLAYLGKNAKNILLLVHYPQEGFLPDEQLVFLDGILKACKLDIEDIAIVNTAKSSEKVRELTKVLNSKTVLLFGEETVKIAGQPALVDFVTENIDGVFMISSPSLEDLNNASHEGKLQKRKLWECLKRLFKV